MTSLEIYNTLTQRKEKFTPSDGNTVRIYACGPTVYALSHLGHARMAVTWDVIQRFMRFLGYNVVFVRNITDVDDKIIARAKELGIRPEQVAREFTYQFWRDMHDLNIAAPDFEPRATDYIPQMIQFIEKLIARDNAYVSDGDVYFAVSSYADYGALGKKNLDELLVGARDQVRSQKELSEKKRSPADFALWKGASSQEPGWQSPWGHGRPGWHIECSTMIHNVLGETIDIHGGGSDLVFPHHENERAQSEAHNHDHEHGHEKPLARYWMHNAMVRVNARKMGKSEGNFTTIRDLLAEFPADAMRLLLLQTHYRSAVDFSREGLQTAKTAMHRLVRAAETATETEVKGDFDSVRKFEAEFIAAMNNDFSTPIALAALFKLADYAGATKDQAEKSGIAVTVRKYASLLGLTLQDTRKELGNATSVAAIDAMLDLRKAARARKDFITSDQIRDRLIELGFQIMDTPGGTTWERI